MHKRQRSYTFRAGYHLAQSERSKSLTDSTITRLVPERVSISLPRESLVCVSAGDMVRRGRVIALRGGLPVACASVGGEVTSVSSRTSLDGISCQTVEITRFAALDEEECEQISLGAAAQTERERLLEILRMSTLVGMGGAGFPTWKKYASACHVRFILINGCECEPYITCDRALMTNHADEVVKGAQLFAAIPNDAKAIICVEKGNSCIDPLRRSAEKSQVAVMELEDRYPQGSEKQLIAAVSGQELPEGALPVDCAVIVNNASTAAAFARCVDSLCAPLERIVTVSGEGVPSPRNVLAPIGTPASDLLEFCGITRRGCVLHGGPMTGRAIIADSAGITLATTGLTAISPPDVHERQCIHCGGCARVCPAQIQPYLIDAAHRKGDWETLKELKCTLCIGCGLCSYICPAKRELTAHTKAARAQVLSAERGRGA